MARPSSKPVSPGRSQPLLSRPPSPPDYLSDANIFSYITFAFLGTFLRLGNSRILRVDDLPSVPSGCKSEKLLATFQKAWNSQKNANPGGKNSILLVCFRCFWRDILKTGLLAAFKGIGTVSEPIFIYFFVDYASGNVRFEHEGIALVVALLFVKVAENICQRHWYFGVRVLGSNVQAALIAAIYDKELRLSSVGRREHTTGEIVNYVSVDAFRLCELAWRLHWGWLVPTILVASFLLSFAVVGLAAIPAAVLIVATLVCLTPLIKSMEQSQTKFMVTQDDRLRATSETLMGMKVIKLQAWEDTFRDFIQQKRDAEFKWLADTQQKRLYATVIYWMTPIILTCTVLVSCLFFGKTLSSTTVFTILATFRIIQDPIRIAPEVLSFFIQALVSFSRLEKFLQEDELRLEELLDMEGKSVSDYRIRVNGAVLSWNPENVIPTLKDINMLVKRGEKVAVCGSVGSGKSTLLLSLLGEVPKLAGTVQMCGRVAYVPQTAWIQTMTVRDNILFGKPFDTVRYRDTLRACALEEDIKTFSHGDLTEVGERGINLSGGQKQRIQLARAVYNDADIYLLDDPFSAVDAQTAAVLFNDCVIGALKDKSVVLVTHQIEFLPLVDTVLVMQDGEVKQTGTYDDLLTAGHQVFEQLVIAHQLALHTVIGDGDSEKGAKRRAKSEDETEAHFPKVQRRLSSEEESLIYEGSKATTQLVQDEVVETGKVGLKPYIHYIKISRGLFLLLATVMGQLVFSVAQVYSNVWLASGISSSQISSRVLIVVYTGLSVVCMVSFGVRSQLMVNLGLRASKAFFFGLMSRIMKAPMVFFDSTPSGRILNRASVDISVIDLDIPFSFGNTFGTSFDVICVIVVMALVTWEILFIMIPVLFLIQFIQGYYAGPARELNRMNSTTKAPIVNNAAETLSGSATIRAFKEEERFRRHNLQLIDRDASAYIYKFAAVEWMVFRIELSCTIVLVIAAILILRPSLKVSSGFAGLSVTYALALNSSLVMFSIWQCFMAIFSVSVERIKQFMELPMEALAVIDTNRPPAGWPHKGKVAFHNLKIRYRENSPLVLKGITCTFFGGQKVGVVGRTGSGKTTLISALFRLVEPASGRICIDDIDIVSIGLHDLRFKLGIIPQDPVLFQGTVRTNLDPLNQYTDREVWETLRKSQLVQTIERLPLQLDSPVSDQGENWSAGQRQLFCLGRVLLKRSQVLVLDEATASIDSATDALLQAVIRDEFSPCTVITIAHRIPTVIDSDMVMALRGGSLIEFEPPKKLMENETSLLSQLVAEYWAQAGRNSTSSDRLSSR